MRLPSCLAFLALAATCWAQSPTASPTPADGKQSEAVQKRDFAQSELDQARQRETALNQEKLAADLKAAGLPESWASDYLNAAHDTVRNYQASLELLNTIINNQRVLADLQKQPAATLPKNVTDVDALRDKIASLRQQSQTVDTQLQLDDAALAKARSNLDAADQQFRLASEEFDATTDPVARRKSGLQLQGAELRQQLASSASFLATWRITRDELEQKIAELNQRRLEKALTDSGLDTIFSQARADLALQRLTQLRTAVRKQLDDTRKTAASLNDTLAALEKNLQAAGQNGRKAEINSLTLRQSIATEASNTASNIIEVCESSLTNIAASEALWQAVLGAVEKPDAGTFQALRDRAETAVADIAPYRDQIPRYLQDVQRRIEELGSTPPSKDAEVRKLEETRLTLLQTRATQLRDLAAAVENQYAVDSQILEESRVQLAARSITERGQQAVQQAASGIRKFWTMELFPLKDASGKARPITVAKLLFAIVSLLIGLALAKLISRTISTRVQRRFSLDPSRGNTLDRALYFTLLAIIILTILNWLSIPLTTFAFLGGALAIGVGFGAQTLMNNFISGLILMAERRIRVGDIIEVDGQTGSVMNLGTRCSRITKGNGVEVLVPNSYFLEKNVANWTLSDPHHCYDFTIGMSYGTDPNAVVPVLLRAITEEPKVLTNPAPRVFFESYGDSALIFHLYYWVNMRGTDNREVGSNIRLRIFQFCRDAGLQIANPQQNVLLSTSQPLGIKVDGGKI